MQKRRLGYVACFLLGLASVFFFLTSFAKQQSLQETLRTPPNPEDIRGWEVSPANQVPTTTPSETTSTQENLQETLRTPPNPADTTGWEIYPSGESPPELPPTSAGFATSAVASPAPRTLLPFTVTLASVRNPLSLIFFDAGSIPNDGDAVRIEFNGQLIQAGLPLTSSGTQVNISASLLRPGLNRISITALGAGTVALNTVGILFPANEVADGRQREPAFAIAPGQTIGATVGFPQISICRTQFQFPCRPSGGLSVFPETAQHVLEVLGTPPRPIFTPVLPGRTGNPLRPSYPRLLTLDRPGASRRRTLSTRNYQTCPANASGASQQRDEYPPATFLENDGSAHIKCISSRDNEQSGNSFGQQINSYLEQPSATPYRIPDGNTIEFVILN
ncbi:MAG: hypothetical protein HC895_01435 [Leptolyngbyaceae cyanobacterium SM1_3_5]|nr:hypothetical protein [Leptolyngbyaceae cyanobacterium SM1_3_5]